MNAAHAAAARPTLEHLPLPLLAIPMGTGGVGLAWRQAHAALGVPAAISEALLALTVVVWVAIVALQCARLLRHPSAVLEETRHPVRVAFVAAPTIGLMIIAAFLHRHAPALAAAVWSVAVTVHLVVAMLLLRRVLAGRGDPAMIAPPLLIPLVGNVLAPVFGAPMGFLDASWMMFGVGMVLWLAVLPLLLYRLFAGPALPPPLRPSLVILVAPPAVGALAVVALTGQSGGPAMALAGVALLLAAVLLSLAGELARIPFGMAWWGTTFPTAAFAVMLMVQGFPAWLCWAALFFTTALTAGVLWRTLRAARAGMFYRPEG
ncbi:SLAC1 anion channel family protein [Falsiroseomonas sp.]|uniref:SLAC1 anion channel family protein n=1 Tax=Falsiroseomonas sp. TaxID=2870721 RepID=UPI0035632941